MQVGSAKKSARYPQITEILFVGILIGAKRFTAKEPVWHSFQKDVDIISLQAETPDFRVWYSRKVFKFQQAANTCLYIKAFCLVFPGYDQNHNSLDDENAQYIKKNLRVSVVWLNILWICYIIDWIDIEKCQINAIIKAWNKQANELCYLYIYPAAASSFQN